MLIFFPFSLPAEENTQSSVSLEVVFHVPEYANVDLSNPALPVLRTNAGNGCVFLDIREISHDNDVYTVVSIEHI